MQMNDPLGDLLTRIRNAQRRGKSTVSSPASKIRVHVLEVLQREGYIRGFTEVEKDVAVAVNIIAFVNNTEGNKFFIDRIFPQNIAVHVIGADINFSAELVQQLQLVFFTIEIIGQG